MQILHPHPRGYLPLPIKITHIARSHGEYFESLSSISNIPVIIFYLCHSLVNIGTCSNGWQISTLIFSRNVTFAPVTSKCWYGSSSARHCSLFGAVPRPLHSLTHWGRNEMNNISQTTFSNVFSSMKMFEFRLKFHWSLFPRVQLTIIQHWFR